VHADSTTRSVGDSSCKDAAMISKRHSVVERRSGGDTSWWKKLRGPRRKVGWAVKAVSRSHTRLAARGEWRPSGGLRGIGFWVRAATDPTLGDRAIQLPRQYQMRAGSDDVTEDSRELFVPIMNEGEVTGVMDQMSADFLASTDPDPTQPTLDEAFEGLTRARLVGYRNESRVVEYDGQRHEANEMVFDVVRLDVTDPASLAELAAVLRIVESNEFGHVLSIGEHHLELWSGEQQVHTRELIGWDTIRWSSVWRSDAHLAESTRFEDWLLRHGIPDARDCREEDE
jgi:hypothetical protein